MNKGLETKVGDLVKHRWGTIRGHGLLVDLEYNKDLAWILWADGRLMELNFEWVVAV